MAYVFGLIAIALSTLLIWKSAYMGQTFPIQWAEQFFSGAGQAGSVTFYRILSVVIIIGSFLAMTGILQKLIITIFGSAGA